MLKESQLLNELEAHAFSPAGEAMCLYGDPAYPHRMHLQGPFKEPLLTPEMEDFNHAMSSIHTSVELVFGDVIGSFKFLDFKKKSENWSESSWQTLHCKCSAKECPDMPLWQQYRGILWSRTTISRGVLLLSNLQQINNT